MKMRAVRSRWGLAVGFAMVVAGCGAPPQPQDEAQQSDQENWAAAPHIDAVALQGGGVLVSGQAPPGARVILSSPTGQAMAAAADGEGRFELAVGRAALGHVLTPEIQIGQTPVPGPERLLVAGDGMVVAALLIDGGPSRRLTEGPTLSAVDGDGRGLLVSGRSTPGARVQVRSEGETALAMADDAGLWTAPLSRIRDRAVQIEVGGDSYAYPGPGAATGRAERAGQGWRVTRALSDAARQTSWFPDVGDPPAAK
ncbi:hypothetical protein H9656_03140 [Brevundimonas sp. Sa3CVA3]|uniref:Carboxypeptidase regulatory-like domain-containing protein n=1 Tax=Brevundimonas guildfordensis TaxID=2762241 RepID=A0ABR8QXW0_9CAUL|nr:hypothetical protein [Brevundimonas guildfordensis]